MHEFTRTSLRRTMKGAGAGAAAAGLLLVGAGGAAAHVHVNPDSTAAGSSSLLTFATSHGCEGSPTTTMTITLPDELHDATPTAKAGWTVETVTEQLDEPVELESGTEIVERVSQIVYTAETPLPDGVRDTFTVGVDLPASAAGETLAFPVLQTCEEGETNWSQVADAGEDAHSLESPAPTFEVTAAEANAGGHGAEAGHGDAEGAGGDAANTAETAGTGDTADTEPAANVQAQSGPGVVGWLALTAGVLGLAAGVAALVLVRKRGA